MLIRLRALQAYQKHRHRKKKSSSSKPYSNNAIPIEPKQNIPKSVRLPESTGELNSITDLHWYHNSSLLSANHYRHHNHHDQQPASRDAVFIGTEGVTEPIVVEKDLEMAKNAKGQTMWTYPKLKMIPITPATRFVKKPRLKRNDRQTILTGKQ